MSFEERRRAYAVATQEFLKLVDTLSEDVIDTRRGDQWSPRQVIHHMADSEMQSAVRLRRLLAEAPGTTIQGYDEAAWAQHEALGYRTSDWRPAVTVITAVRAGSLEVLMRLSEVDLSRSGVHSESGPYSLSDWLDIYTAHPRDHAQQIREALGS